MTSRFPAPWRIVEISNGFVVEDASGQHLVVFYGRVDPNNAGHTGFLTIDEARQMAVDFTRLPELLKQTSNRSEMAKAAPRCLASSRTPAQTVDGRQPPKPLEHLSTNMAWRSLNRFDGKAV